MIDMTRESLLTLNQAAKLPWMPERRNCRRPHVATLHRWATKGLNDVRLETVQVGGSRCTSREALARFFDALAKKNRPVASTDSQSVGADAEHADAELDRLGF